MSWHKKRFEHRPGAVEVACETCARPMWLPPSKVGEYKTCGGLCAKKKRQAGMVARTRDCQTCGNTFTPRQVQVSAGHGRFCSQACNTAARDALQSKDAETARIKSMRAKRAAGQWTILSGSENPMWKGGREAQWERRRAKAVEWTRKYRANNPEKVKEWAQRRAGRKLDKLPYGTIPKLRSQQRNKCAICSKKLSKDWHVDHIMPLARGGKHKPKNLQILCPPCNLAKSARDPIKHMQSLGRLL
jgi:5-methylcytosine-specific restriction endonuclease McrA